jgi:hypothetical protein
MTAGTTPSRSTCGVARRRCGRAASESNPSGRCCTTRVTGCLARSCSRTCWPRSAGVACPRRIVATVMVLRRLGGLSDREASRRSASMPAGSTPVVGWRSTISASAIPCWWTWGRGWPSRPGRSGSCGHHGGGQPGWAGRVRRVLDSTPLDDAVAAMDTVTLLGAAIPGAAQGGRGGVGGRAGGVLAGADDYAGLAKPPIDGDDQAARAVLVDAPARDAHGVLGSCRAARCRRRWLRPLGCWAPSSAKTWSRATMAASGWPVRSPPTG